jgi:hypothetical protein
MKLKTTIVPANGVTGCLLPQVDGTVYFRVYNADGTFADYKLRHSDLFVTIADEDAFFYSGPSGQHLDHSPKTLGIKT